MEGAGGAGEEEDGQPSRALCQGWMGWAVQEGEAALEEGAGARAACSWVRLNHTHASAPFRETQLHPSGVLGVPDAHPSPKIHVPSPAGWCHPARVPMRAASCAERGRRDALPGGDVP